jgi:P-type Ca2+ transporter type 2C
MADINSLGKKNKGEIYNQGSGKIIGLFDSTFAGLSQQEAENRLKRFGKNKIHKKIGWRKTRIILEQMKDALIWILLVAAGLAFFFGEVRDVMIILAIVFINALVGFFQEFKAEKIIDKLKNFVSDSALVIRQGKKKEIESEKIVLGDVVFLSAGDDVPADGYLLEAFDLRVNSFVFSGESKDESRRVGTLKEKKVALSDIQNMLFLGESIVAGEAKMLVTATGMETELGKIASMTQKIADDPTPLQRKMKKLSGKIVFLSVLIGIMVMIFGFFFKVNPYESFLFALALAVSVVPEGLPAAISVTLSIGMKKLAARGALAKKLSAVETLGSVSVICTDKTGTITKNELTVVKIILADKELDVTGNGYEPIGDFISGGQKIDPQKVDNLEQLLRIGALCNDASLIIEDDKHKIIGDPTEGALVVVAKKYNSCEGFFEKGEHKIGEIPFSSDRMRMSVIYRNSRIVSYVKGSPDILIDLCQSIKVGNKIRSFSSIEKEKIKAQYNQLSKKALRVLAMAYRDLEETKNMNQLKNGAEQDLVWVGMMAMTDPPRKEVAEAIADCRNLGLIPIMITGDYEITAKAIAEKIGLLAENSLKKMIISGKELNSLSDSRIYRRIKEGVCVFSRISPAQKLRIASILIKNGQIIAMTGDGVNDAPALKKADVGVAMGIMGTDVSKEAADIILLDDNFASIVSGIKEGRTIFSNLRKFIYYILSSNSGELFSVLFGVILRIPAPITAIQILSIDLATDVFPSFSLGVEPPEKNGSGYQKNIVQKDLIDFSGFRRIVQVGMIMAFCGVLAFIWSMFRGGWHFGLPIATDAALYVKSTTATYAVLAMSQMANLLQSRSEKMSPFSLGFFENKYAISSIFISFSILLIFMYSSFFQKYLKMAPIDAWDWMMVVFSFSAVFVFEELRKWRLSR